MKRLLAALLVLAIAGQADAAVVVNSVVGTFAHGNSVGVSVTGQGSKSPAGPILWDDFSGGSLNPSSLGSDTSFEEIQNMAYTATGGFGGTGGAVGTAGIGQWTLRIDRTGGGASWSEFNQKNYIFRRTKMNFLIVYDFDNPNAGTAKHNWKVWRCWNQAGVAGSANIYIAANNGRCFVENMGTETGFWSDFNIDSTAWTAEEIITKASSASNVKDGLLTYRTDGDQRASGSILTHTSANPNFFRQNYVVHGVNANKTSWNPPWSNSNQMWTDEIYVDNTWQRVMIGDANTFANCHKFGFIIPTSWSTSNITGTVSVTDFVNGQQAYVYVFDTNNTPNASGYPITINGTVAGDPPPTISSVVPGTGNAGNTVQINGTGFNSAVVLLCGLDYAAPVTSTLSSVLIEFEVPEGQAGRTCDVRVSQPSGSAALANSFTYNAAAVTNPPVDPGTVASGKTLMAFR